MLTVAMRCQFMLQNAGPHKFVSHMLAMSRNERNCGSTLLKFRRKITH
jgi:hypothetical protein